MLKIDLDEIVTLSDKFIVKHEGVAIPYDHQEQLVRYGTHIALEAFNADHTQTIDEILDQVRGHFIEDLPVDATSPTLLNIENYTVQLIDLIHSSLLSLGLRVKSNNKTTKTDSEEENEIIDASGEQGRSTERYDESIYEMKDLDKASFRLKAKLALIEKPLTAKKDSPVELTTLGFPVYVDAENAFITIKNLLVNRPNLTITEALDILRNKKHPNYRWLNAIADTIQTWDQNTKNEFITVFRQYKVSAKIALWNTKDGSYSANLIDADRNSGGRMMVEGWESNFFDLVNKTSNLVISDPDDKFLINAEKIKSIRSRYLEVVADYDLSQSSGFPDMSTAKRLAKLLNEVKIDVTESDIQSILDDKENYARIAENYTSKRMSYIFDEKSGVLGTIFSVFNIPPNAEKAVKKRQDGYISYKDYNPFSYGGNFLSKLGVYVSHLRENQGSTSFMSSSGNMHNLYTIFDPLTETVANIRNQSLKNEALSAFGRNSRFLDNPGFDVIAIDSLKNEDTGDFQEAKQLTEIEIELNELASIQNNGNSRRIVIGPTNSDKSRNLPIQINALRDTSEFVQENIETNSIQLVTAINSEIERMNAYREYALSEDGKVTKTGNIQLDNGYKFFYLVPNANIQLARKRVKELLTGLLTAEEQIDTEALRAKIKSISKNYNARYLQGFDKYSSDPNSSYSNVLNKPDLAHMVFLATQTGTQPGETELKNIDDFTEAIITNNYNFEFADVLDLYTPHNNNGFISLIAADAYNQEVAAKLDFWKKSGINSVNTPKGKNGMDRMDAKWKAKLTNGREFNDAEILKIAAREAVAYNQHVGLHFYKTIAGDPVSFYKGPVNKESIDISNAEKKSFKVNDLTAQQTADIINATSTETIKRNAKNLAAGTKPYFNILQYNPVSKEWEPGEQTHYLTAVINDNERASINASILASPYLRKMYGEGKMNVADALEYTSMEEHLHVMYAKGDFKLNDNLYKKLLKKAYVQDRLKAGQAVPESAKLSGEELKYIFGMMKPVQVSNYRFQTKSMMYPLQTEVYIKSSSMPLIHQVFGNLDIAKIKESMFYKDEIERVKPINRVAYKSAVKAGAVNIANVWKDNKIESKELFAMELPRSGFYIQQEIPYDETKNQIRIMSQMDKLLLEGFDNIDPKLIERKGQIRKDMFQAAQDEIIKKFDIDKDTGKFKDMSKVIEILKREAMDRGYSPNTLEYLRVDDNGELVTPIFFNAAANKYESLIASIFSKIVLQKVHGHSYVQTSSAGLMTIKDLSDEIKNDIILVDGHTMKEDLPFITKGEDKIEAAGVYVPFQFLDNKGNKLNPKDFTYKNEAGETIIDPNRVPPELLNLIGGRIPGQGPNSMLPIKILGFLPEYMANTIVVPAEIVVQMGSDFKGNFVHTYMNNYVYNELNNTIQKYYSSVEDIKILQDKYFSIYWSVLTDLRMFEKIAEPMNFMSISNNKSLSSRLPTVNSLGLLSPLLNREFLMENKSRKFCLAIIRNFINFNSIVIGTNLEIMISDESISIQVEEGLSSIHLNSFGNNHYSVSPNKLSSAHYGLIALQSEMFDNTGNGILTFYNLNRNTINALCTLIALREKTKSNFGEISLEQALLFLSHPIIKKYINRKNKEFNLFGSKYNVSKEIELKRQMILEIYKNINPESNERKNIDQIIMENLCIPALSNLSNEKELNNIDPNESISSNSYLSQLKVLSTFFFLDDLGYLILKVVNCLRPMSSGIGKSFIESYLIEKDFNQLIQKNSLTTNHLKIRINGLEKLADSIQGNAVKQSVVFANKVIEPLFPYKNLFKFTNSQYIKEKIILDEKSLRTFINNYKKHVFCCNNMYEKQNGLELTSLLNGFDNLFDRLQLYKELPNSEGKYLVDNLVIKQMYRNCHNGSGLKYPAGRIQRKDSDKNTNALIMMLNSRTPWVKKLAIDLISFSFLTNPTQSANNFIMFIPASIYQCKNISTHLKEENKKLLDESFDFKEFLNFLEKN